MKDYDIRQSYYHRFPSWSQHFWTWFTGKAVAGQKPLFIMYATGHFITTLALYFIGLTLSFTITQTIGWQCLLLPITWVITLGGARKMAATLLHQCVHARFSGHEKFDMFIAELISVLLFSQDAHSYRIEHCTEHHNKSIFATEKDPIAKFLLTHGYKKGMSHGMMWLNMLAMVLSPVYHFKFFCKRFKHNLIAVSLLRRLAAVAFISFWAYLLYTQIISPISFLLAFVVPMIFLYNISVLLEMMSEHTWLIENKDKLSEREFYARRCWGRFFGEPLPDNNLKGLNKLYAWSAWTMKMVCYHLVARVAIISGDLPQHDYHHRRPGCVKWYLSAYTRQMDIENGHPGWPEYREVWGLLNAIDNVFAGISTATPCPATIETKLSTIQINN